MELLLRRLKNTEERVQGELFLGERFFCYTVEDTVRTGPKVKGATAIPPGRYQILLTFSNRFKKVLPLLLKVPQFEGVRMHSGNTEKDTEGCILVGKHLTPFGVRDSRITMNLLMEELERMRSCGEPMWITIENSFAVSPQVLV